MCGPLVPEDVRKSVGWLSVPYEKFIFTANALRSVAHVLPFNVRPLYLECGSDLDTTGRELSTRLINSLYKALNKTEEMPERRKFFLRLVGRDPDKTRWPLTFPSTFEVSRGEAAKLWAVSASDGREVVKAAESLLDFAGQDAQNFIELLRRDSPRFAKEELLETVRESIVQSNGYIPKLLTVARASADYSTYFLSWWV